MSNSTLFLIIIPNVHSLFHNHFWGHLAPYAVILPVDATKNRETSPIAEENFVRNISIERLMLYQLISILNHYFFKQIFNTIQDHSKLLLSKLCQLNRVRMECEYSETGHRKNAQRSRNISQVRRSKMGNGIPFHRMIWNLVIALVVDMSLCAIRNATDI